MHKSCLLAFPAIILPLLVLWKTAMSQICPAIVGTKEEVVSFLQGKNMLHSNRTCCASQIQLQKRQDTGPIQVT